MSDAIIIFQKEVKNFFKDRRTLFSTFLLPLFIIPILFIGMGSVLQFLEADAQSTTYAIAIEGNNDQRFLDCIDEQLSYRLTSRDEADIIITFPPGYVQGIHAQVVITYDSSSQKNQYAHQQVIIAIQIYQELLAENLLELHGLSLASLLTLTTSSVDVASEVAQSGGTFLAMLVPYFLLIFLFSGSINAGLDTTCGEKERGSLAILLVNQVSRTSIAWGKILYVSVVAICSAKTTFLGFVLSLLVPSGAAFMFPAELSGASLSGISLLIMVAVLSTAALFTGSVVALLGSLAKSVKEGGTYVMPLYMIVVLIGVTTMYMDSTSNGVFYFIPIVNTIFVMKEVLLGMITPWHVVVTICANIAIAGVCAYGVAQLFNSEKILQMV